MESPLNVTLVCLDTNPEKFFNFLPDDWSIDIAPVWAAYQDSSHIYALLDDTATVLGGGIIFTTVSPDIAYAFDLANQWLDNGYNYIAYLFIDEKLRGKGLGSKWLQSVLALHPTQKYWLTIDDYDLSAYYQKNQFEMVTEITSLTGSEWIMKFEPK